jgi:hypothetical protein
MCVASFRNESAICSVFEVLGPNCILETSRLF